MYDERFSYKEEVKSFHTKNTLNKFLSEYLIKNIM